jgi:hypothetical protein
VKYAVPPVIFVPLGLVGSVNPGPPAGSAAEVVEADAPLPLLDDAPPLLLGLEDPHAAASSTTETAPRTVIDPLMPLRILAQRLSKTATRGTSNLLTHEFDGLVLSTIGSSHYRPLTDR